ncbi:MAG: hypothetical protein J6Y94_00920 [Bacteriovoracaceae bacterium]|nr:hypothetical protein [Bacteriovoracaceae bacterium]
MKYFFTLFALSLSALLITSCGNDKGGGSNSAAASSSSSNGYYYNTSITNSGCYNSAVTSNSKYYTSAGYQQKVTNLCRNGSYIFAVQKIVRVYDPAQEKSDKKWWEYIVSFSMNVGNKSYSSGEVPKQQTRWLVDPVEIFSSDGACQLIISNMVKDSSRNIYHAVGYPLSNNDEAVKTDGDRTLTYYDIWIFANDLTDLYNQQVAIFNAQHGQ